MRETPRSPQGPNEKEENLKRARDIHKPITIKCRRILKRRKVLTQLFIEGES